MYHAKAKFVIYWIQLREPQDLRGYFTLKIVTLSLFSILSVQGFQNRAKEQSVEPLMMTIFGLMCTAPFIVVACVAISVNVRVNVSVNVNVMNSVK